MNFVQPIRDPDKIQEVIAWLRERSARNCLLFITGIYSGLRISDLLKLRRRDFTGKYLVIKDKKTSKKSDNTRHIYIIATLRREVEAYCEAHHVAGNDLLFPSRQGGTRPISRARAYQVLREAAQACRLDHIGTHTLRKTFGFHFYQQTKDVALLQEFFKHSDPSITLRYIGVNQKMMDSAMQKLRFQA